MSDGEIEYLGSKAPSFTPALQRPVTGIVLHVEKNDSNSEPYRLTFNRASSSVIHVGRRPGAESESRTRDIDSGRAMFRCAVVSRKHAKLAFSDTGSVYVIDCSSHHGTHVRKSGELWAKPIQPEVPFSLSDGDLITFGKTVGRNDECVRPVVVRVELLRGPPPIKPLVVPTTPESDKSSSSATSRHSSGRYGVVYSSDERSSSPPFNDESDPEPIEVGVGNSQQDFSSGFGRAFDMLKRLIPPSQTPNSISLPPVVPSLDFAFEDPQWGVPNLSIPKSRSNSPMDLESPSPAPAPPLPLEGMPDELSPSPKASRCSSPAANVSEHVDRSESENDDEDAEASEIDEDEGRPKCLSPEPALQEESSKASEASHQNETADMRKTIEALQAEVARLDAHRRKYRTRFNNNVHRLAEKLSHYDDRLAEVNAQYDNLAEKVETISRIELADLTCQIDEVNEQVENMAYVDIPDLQSRVDGLDDDMAETAKKEKEEALLLAKLVQDMRDIQASTEAQMKAGLEEVKELCKTTMLQIAAEHEKIKLSLAAPALYAAAQEPPSTSPALKRKRDVEDEGEHVEKATCTDGEMSQSCISPEPDFNEAMEETDDDSVFDGLEYNLEDSPSPRKKLRTVAKVVAKTAATVTLGAVATWGVLAFA